MSIFSLGSWARRPNVDILQTWEMTLQGHPIRRVCLRNRVPKWGSTNQHPQPKEAFEIAMVTGSRTLSNPLPRVDAV
jgi:hypothetical protein